ncbi:CPBP family intramembrane glutamic endopeptidase [Chamaesiphon polymorphus]|uniref:CPBP family intramembrane metalloprotease n=1 Tax=Chamaesiphon polymorphus CCALA 037 TaxID=2107692 RepID=A0A2T1GCG4_9CYAN|nr:CPBP family intramembrane glutamic endopeptidase [Chamaesiphon polymorphus]PSB55065.1 CPBP family intramembrane metalloprotease [Chamaesiphon polymorphus CCALA 037]
MQNLATINFDRFKVRYLLLMLLVMNIASTILLSAIGIGVNDRLFVPIGYIGSFLATCLWIWYRCDRVKIDLKQVIGKPDRAVQWLRVIGLTIAGLIFSLASFLVILGLISYIFPNFAEQILTVVSKNRSTAINSGDTLLYRILNFLMIVVVAPISEELIFRGIILNRWAQKWNLQKSLIATSLLFGFLHINPIGLSMVGLVLALLYLKTKTLWVPIAAHAMNNFIAFCATIPASTKPATTTVLSLQSLQSSFWTGLVMMGISLFFLGRFIRRNFPSKQLSSFS